MPFGLTNAPAVFQRLMQKVLDGLNPDEGPDFVEVYIDDVLVFSRTMEEHVEHLRQVLARLRKAGLKLKPTKCHFIRQAVEYLGHVITPDGLKPNPKQVSAIQDYLFRSRISFTSSSIPRDDFLLPSIHRWLCYDSIPTS